jgi:hypothetical protein
MSDPDVFFAFNPRAVRWGLALGAVLCAALAAWALANARAGLERFGAARGGVAAGLMFAFGYVVLRLRPRPGWGVRLTPLALVIARPFTPQPLELPWSQISVVRQEGGRRPVLSLFLRTGERILVPQHLFSNRGAFDAMAQAVSARVPVPVLDS